MFNCGYQYIFNHYFLVLVKCFPANLHELLKDSELPFPLLLKLYAALHPPRMLISFLTLPYSHSAPAGEDFFENQILFWRALCLLECYVICSLGWGLNYLNKETWQCIWVKEQSLFLSLITTSMSSLDGQSRSVSWHCSGILISSLSFICRPLGC